MRSSSGLKYLQQLPDNRCKIPSWSNAEFHGGRFCGEGRQVAGIYSALGVLAVSFCIPRFFAPAARRGLWARLQFSSKFVLLLGPNAFVVIVVTIIILVHDFIGSVSLNANTMFTRGLRRMDETLHHLLNRMHAKLGASSPASKFGRLLFRGNASMGLARETTSLIL